MRRIRPVRWLKLWCKHCGYKTQHECRPDVPNDHGLLWRCERCLRSEPRTTHETLTAERETR